MRIGHVAPVIYPVPPGTYGGTERVITDLATGQVAMGHDLVLFGPVDSTLGGVTRIGEYPSLSALQHEHGDVPPGIVAELEAQQLRDILRYGRECDVLHLHGCAQASSAAQACGVPVFRTIHWRADELDHAVHFDAFPEERIIAISNRQASDVPAANLAGVVHHGIPADRYRTGAGSGGYLAFLGRMTDQKRPDRAIDLARRTGIPLRLAGPVDPGNPTYFARHVEPVLGGDIVHVGSVTDTEKQDFLANAAGLVFSIDWPEPFGLVMIEAMACGTPVIAWRNGSVAEIVEDGVSGIIVEDIDEAEERFSEVLRLDRAKVRQAFETRFLSGRMAAQTTALYAEALEIVE